MNPWIVVAVVVVLAAIYLFVGVFSFMVLINQRSFKYWLFVSEPQSFRLGFFTVWVLFYPMILTFIAGWHLFYGISEAQQNQPKFPNY